MFRGSVTGTGNPLHSPVSPSLPRPCVAVCHHISTGLYYCVVVSIIVCTYGCKVLCVTVRETTDLDQQLHLFSNYLKRLEDVPEDQNI